MENITRDNKIKIAFIYQVASFWTSWDSLYSKCLCDNKIEVMVFRIDGEHGDKAQMKDSEQFLKNHDIEYKDFSYKAIMEFKPDYMIYQTPYDKGHRPIETWTARYKKEGIKIVYIPYGIEISDTKESRYKHFSLSVVLNAFSVFVMSESIKREYEKYCINKDAVKDLGLPRFDALMRRYDIPAFYKNNIKGRKVVLWKSHFPKVFIEEGVKKQATPDLDEYISFIDYIKKTPNLYFVFMPHPKFADDTIDDTLKHKAEKILYMLRGLENVSIDLLPDYRSSLTNADAIIVDRSAVMVEAGAKNVPVLYMYNEHYKEPMPEPIHNLVESYYQGTLCSDMISFCEMVKNDEDVKKEIRKRRFKECVEHVDGKCALRIVESLISGAKEEYKNEMVRKLKKGDRLLFFGTGDISNFCLEETKNCEKKAEIIGFLDNNSSKWGTKYGEYLIFSPSALNELVYDYVVIATDKYYLDVYSQLINMGVSKKKIINYDQYIILERY